MSDDDEILMDFDEELIERRLNLWLCAELWTDIFKLLSRCNLVQSVEPVCRRFKKICDKNVENIHLITKADEFIAALANNQPNALEKYAHLKANNCPLAGQFQLQRMQIWISRRESEIAAPNYKRRRRYQMCVMRHCLDLFTRCSLYLNFPEQKILLPGDFTEYLAYLKYLEPVKLGHIVLTLHSSLASRTITDSMIDELMNQPAILNCNRLTLIQTNRSNPGAQAINKWLHHTQNNDDNTNVIEMANADIAGGEHMLKELPLKFRCMNILNNSMLNILEELLDSCVQNLHQAQSENDCRPFVLYFFYSNKLTEFQLENTKSGEKMALENVKKEGVLETPYYLLWRCLTSEQKSTENFIKEISQTPKIQLWESSKSTVVKIS